MLEEKCHLNEKEMTNYINENKLLVNENVQMKKNI